MRSFGSPTTLDSLLLDTPCLGKTLGFIFPLCEISKNNTAAHPVWQMSSGLKLNLVSIPSLSADSTYSLVWVFLVLFCIQVHRNTKFHIANIFSCIQWENQFGLLACHVARNWFSITFKFCHPFQNCMFSFWKGKTSMIIMYFLKDSRFIKGVIQTVILTKSMWFLISIN